MLMGLAGMTKNLHLLKGESSFKRVLIDAHTKRIGSNEGYTSVASAHKHILQLVKALRIKEGQHGVELDPDISMPPPPTPLAPRSASLENAAA